MPPSGDACPSVCATICPQPALLARGAPPQVPAWLTVRPTGELVVSSVFAHEVQMLSPRGGPSCIVTKAGPGTIAEACCCGLPIMLSGYLPGQESGNVGHVVDGGFGAYSSDPSELARTAWLRSALADLY